MSTPFFPATRTWRRGFSLVEALATVAIIGIITFLALPNIVKMRRDAERNMAIARAEAFNLGVAAYVQGKGVDKAAQEWGSATTTARFGFVRPYLAFAPERLQDYISDPYSLNLADYTIQPGVPLAKVQLLETGERDEEGNPQTTELPY